MLGFMAKRLNRVLGLTALDRQVSKSVLKEGLCVVEAQYGLLNRVVIPGHLLILYVVGVVPSVVLGGGFNENSFDASVSHNLN